MNPEVLVVGVLTQVDSSRGSYWCTGSSVARYRPSQAILNRSWARYLICPVYQSGSSSPGTTFSTCHTGRVEITHCAVRGDRVGQVGPQPVPALSRPAGVGRGAPLGEVHLADVQVVAGRVIPPLVGHALEHRDELEQVDHALVVGVLVQPLAQVPVVPPVQFLVRRLEQRLDDLLELG